jgi:transposase-like protein
MLRKSKETTAAEGGGSVPIPAALLDELVKGPMSPTDVQALFQSFKHAVIERAMGAEMSHHLGYRAGAARPDGETNHRNGHTGKTVLTEDGPLRMAVPRDRDGTFEPILIPKHARRFTGFDDKIAVVDGLTGLADAIETAFPTTTVQTCIQSWQRAWAQVIPFFAFPPAVWRVIYTTNAIESLHMRLRKIIKTRGHFPTDDAALKLLWLTLQNTVANTTRSVLEWYDAMNQFAIFYGDCFTRPA